VGLAQGGDSWWSVSKSLGGSRLVILRTFIHIFEGVSGGWKVKSHELPRDNQAPSPTSRDSCYESGGQGALELADV